MSPQDDDRVTLQQAAVRLGLSEKTVRRRIRSGRMLAELVPGPRGPQYLLLLSIDERTPTATEPATLTPATLTPAGDVPTNTSDGHADTSQELAALRAELATVREGMARMQEQMAELVALLSER